MSDTGSKKYIGVDLGAWSGTKTRIAILEYNGGNLKLLKLEREPTTSTEKSEIRNEELKDYLLKVSGDDKTIIAIDAPFAVPSPLACCKNMEKYYPTGDSIDKKLAMQNQYLYDKGGSYLAPPSFSFQLYP